MRYRLFMGMHVRYQSRRVPGCRTAPSETRQADQSTQRVLCCTAMRVLGCTIAIRVPGRAHAAGAATLLWAAELQGAAHQAVMGVQVITGKRMSRIREGCNLIVFYCRNRMAAIIDGMEDTNSDTGRMKLSSPLLTALDLVRYGKGSAGIDNVATVLSDLGPRSMVISLRSCPLVSKNRLFSVWAICSTSSIGAVSPKKCTRC